MSEDITIGTATETILGTVADAIDYIGMMLGERYDAWAALDPTKQKKSLVNAVRFLNAWPWSADADTFEKRDAIEAFQQAEYELAVLIVEDSEITDDKNQGSNVQSLKAGSAGIAFFNPIPDEDADPLHPVLMRLVGKYLAVTSSQGPQGGTSQAGSCHNPFSSCSSTDRIKPW